MDTTTRRVTWSGAMPVDPDDARQRILDAAVRCVSRVGVERTSTALIAREAGVSRPTLYAYFENREEIVAQAAEQAVRAIIGRLQDHCRTFETAAERAVEALASAVEQIRSEPAMAVFFEPNRLRLGPLGSDELYFATTVLAPVAELATLSEDAAELFARTMFSSLTRAPAHPRSAKEERAYLRRWWPSALGL